MYTNNNVNEVDRKTKTHRNAVVLQRTLTVFRKLSCRSSSAKM